MGGQTAKGAGSNSGGGRKREKPPLPGGKGGPAPGFPKNPVWPGAGLGTMGGVKVPTGGGRTWKDAQLEEPVYRIAHTRFRYLDWNWNGEEAVLQSRCTDDRGTVQPSLAQF